MWQLRAAATSIKVQSNETVISRIIPNGGIIRIIRPNGIGLENEPQLICRTDVIAVGIALPRAESVLGLLNSEEPVVVHTARCEVLSTGSEWHTYGVT